MGQQDEGDDQLGRLGGDRDDPLQQEVGLDADERAGAEDRVTERHRGEEDRRRREEHETAHPLLALRRGQRRELRRDADDRWRVTADRRDPADVQHVQGDEDRRVEQGQLAADHAPDRPDAPEPEDRELETVRLRE